MSKNKIRSQRRSTRIPYSPKIQPDINATDNMRGTTEPTYMPEFLRPPINVEGFEDVFLRPSPKSIVQDPAGVYALFSEDGTIQNIPPDTTFLLMGTVPVVYDGETNTYRAAETAASTVQTIPTGFPSTFEVVPGSLRYEQESFTQVFSGGAGELIPALAPENTVILRSLFISYAGTIADTVTITVNNETDTNVLYTAIADIDGATAFNQDYGNLDLSDLPNAGGLLLKASKDEDPANEGFVNFSVYDVRPIT